MAKRKLFKTVHVNSDSEVGNSEFDLKYYVLEKEIRLEKLCIFTYGIEISKCSRDKQNSREYRKVYDVFGTQKEAEEILEKLARNTVTPVSLLEVLENLIGTGDFVNEESSFLIS